MQPRFAVPGLIHRTHKESINMEYGTALFLFLAAAVVATFAFCSIVVWVSTPARERQARDRIALLKTLAENPSDTAREVLALLREEEGKRAARRQAEEKRGYVVGGLVVMAVGVGLGVMLLALGNDGGVWSVGLIPFLIGCVLLGAGLFSNRQAPIIRS
jgi:hypothetical protein